MPYGWTEEEIKILTENFPRLSLDGKQGPINKESLIAMLPRERAWKAIKWKAHKLGLKRDFRLVYPPLKISDVDKAYIAGLVDGEGCITVLKQTRKSGNINYFVYLSISNKDLEVLKWIEKITGLGKVRRLTPTKISKRSEKWKQRPWTWSDCYTYGINNRASCYRFLKDIGSYMKIKKEHADLLLEFLEIKANKKPAGAIRDKNTGYFIKRLPTEITDREHEIHDRFRELNSRGWRKYD